MNKPWNRGFGSNGYSRKALEPRVRIQRVLEKALEPRVRVQRVLEENTGTAVRVRFRPEPVCFITVMSSMWLYGKLHRSIVNEPMDGGFSCIDFF